MDNAIKKQGNSKITNSPVPFVKWAGGKRKLAPLLIETFPDEFDPERHRDFEPFIGGGALMFALGNPRSEVGEPLSKYYFSHAEARYLTYGIL